MHLKLAVAATLTAGLLAAQPYPAEQWQQALPEEVSLDPRHLAKARDYALGGEGSGLVVRNGKAVFHWGDQQKLYDLKSTSKSIAGSALGLALGDGKLTLETAASECLPELKTETPESDNHERWLNQITVFHLATQTAGFDKPGGYSPLLFEPGTQWAYSDSGPNWLADCLTNTYQRDLEGLLFDRVFKRLGIKNSDLRWRENNYRPKQLAGVARREAGSGVHTNVNAMARFGLLFLHNGSWSGQQLLPESFVRQATRPQPELLGLPVRLPERYSNASDHYGLLWWNNADGTLTGVPRDTYWSWGLYDSLIVVIPSLDMVIARAGKSFEFEKENWSHYGKLEPFLRPIVAAAGAPYPASDLKLDWAPAESIVRLAEGSDNWPLTWGDDGAQYTAYGDGWGFEPKVDRKLSLGFAKLLGGPDDPRGINIRTQSGEKIGQGPAGIKAGGILMVERTLYLLARNTENAQLAWSQDHGETWTWANWKFIESFGAPTFLNFGKNYDGARDDYVYIYSHDDASAYVAADQMVLARVPKQRLRDAAAYEYYAGGDPPRWTADVAKRQAVFVNPGRVYRSGITYNQGLERYLWCQIIPGDDTRFSGGFGVYDAPEPWGPWTTVSHIEQWDVGPGETCSFPTKWMSADGKTIHMVFSGDDFFSVRKATVSQSE